MIDTKELRRLAQAATPHVGHACKYQDAHWLREGHVDFENADLFIASERPQEDAEFYAAANPATVIELLDRLETAEKEVASLRQGVAFRDDVVANLAVERDALRAKIEQMAKLEAVERECNAMRAEAESWKGLAAQFGRDADEAKTHLAFAKDELNHLRAKIEAMEKQEPVAWLHESRRDSDVVTSAVKHVWQRARPMSLAAYSIPLYLAPGAQPAPGIPEGWKLVPIEPTHEMLDAGEDTFVPTYTGTPVSAPIDVYCAMLAAAPEAKP